MPADQQSWRDGIGDQTTKKGDESVGWEGCGGIEGGMERVRDGGEYKWFSSYGML